MKRKYIIENVNQKEGILRIGIDKRIKSDVIIKKVKNKSLQIILKYNVNNMELKNILQEILNYTK